MRFIFLSFFFIGLFLITHSFALEPQENKKVKKISIFIMKGENPVESPFLLSKLKTKENETFNSLLFDDDLKLLAKEYDRVEPEVIKKEQEVLISIKLWQRPLIKKIVFEGNQFFKTTTLRHELKVSEGSFLKRDELAQALYKIKEYYLKRGFFESLVTYKISPFQNSQDEVVLTIHIKEGRSYKIENINFHGVTKDEEKQIKAQLISQPYNIFISWMTGQGKYNEDILEQDYLTILNFLHDQGYADAKVEIKIPEKPKSKGISFDIYIDKGQIYHIGTITVDGNSLIDKEKILSSILIKPGGIFSPEKTRESSQIIKDLYGKMGYIESEVNFETNLKELEPIYNISFHIVEGEAFQIGMIRIFGNTRTNTNVILRESLLIPGEKFDTRRLKATQLRLQNIGYFKNVNVYAVRSSDDFSLGPNFRDIHIEVEEDSTAAASASVGMSSLDDVFGVLQFTEKNFNFAGIGHLRSEGLSALRGGGEYVHIKGTYGKRQQAVLFSWATPYVHDSNWRLGYELSYTRSQLQSRDYMVATYGGSIYVSYPFSNYWTYGNRYRVRNADIDVQAKAGTEAKEQERNSGIISALSASLTYDSTDNAMKAHRGIRSFFETEFAGLGGDTYFFKFSYINSVYFPIWSKGTLKLRADFRFMEPTLHMTKEKVPLSERFFLGGETTVRGYRNYILGPRFKGSDDPTGGISSTLLSLEYSQYLNGMMDAFVFVDFGNISQRHFAIEKLNGSYGIGLRVDILHRLPLEGGICLPISPDKKDDFKYYFFSMSGMF